MMERQVKGLAPARRVGGFRRGDMLSRHGEEELFRVAEVLSEGGERDGAYFGSTMITFRFERLRAAWRGSLDADEGERLRRAVDGSAGVRLRAMRIAREEVARRLPDRSLGMACFETRITLHSDALHIDLDVEVPVAGRARRDSP
jgi:hypothetical protein